MMNVLLVLGCLISMVLVLLLDGRVPWPQA